MRSPNNSSAPLTARKPATTSGLANRLRRECSNRPPTITAGMVATTISTSTRRLSATWCGVPDKPSTPRAIASQSRQKNPSSAKAVPTCSMTRNGRNSGAPWSMLQRNTAGTTTAWPRLLTGNNSVAPWMTAISKACSVSIEAPSAVCPAEARCAALRQAARAAPKD